MPKTKFKDIAPVQPTHNQPKSRPAVLLPEVFILETLRLEDERLHRYEGRALMDMLYLSGKRPIYHYFTHENELPLLIELFKLSKYRFLHISCHGEKDRIFTTHGHITDYQLARYLHGSLGTRRLFFSACKVGNQAFSEILGQSNVGVQSIVAPVQKIKFDHAAAIWNALYVSLFAENPERMTHGRIATRLESLANLFPIDLHLSTYHPDIQANPWKHQTIKTTMALSKKPQPVAISAAARVNSYLAKTRAASV